MICTIYIGRGRDVKMLKVSSGPVLKSPEQHVNSVIDEIPVSLYRKLGQKAILLEMGTRWRLNDSQQR